MSTLFSLDYVSLEVTGQILKSDRAALACRTVEPDIWCHHCGCRG